MLAVVLVAFGVGLTATNRARLAEQIDRELRDRAQGPRPPRQGGPGPGFGFGGGLGNGPGGGFGRQGPGPQDLPPVQDEAARIAEIRRPRVFTADGQPAGQSQSPAFDLEALRVALQGRPDFRNIVYRNERVRIFTQPRRSPDGEIVGAVQVARETRDLDQIWRNQLGTLAWFLPIALLVAAGGAFFLTDRAMRPIGRMRRTADEITARDLGQRLPVEGRDEFAELSRTFNAMLGRLEESFERQRTAYAELETALENQKRFTADASHELRTPLTRMRLATSGGLSPDATPAEQRHALEVADAAALSMSRLVQQLLTLARADAGQLRLQLEPLDLRLPVSEALSMVVGDAEERVVASFPETAVMVEAEADAIRRITANLLENAIRYSPKDVPVQLALRTSAAGAHLVVEDRGEGIAPEHLPHLGERFYRADPARARTDGGCGLGLSICKTLAEAMGGRLAIQSFVGRGTSVEIFLPFSRGEENQTISK